MGKINSRNKGASFEREVAKLVNNYFEEIGFDFKVKRNLEQYQEKDLGDLNMPNHTIECKRYASGNWYKEEWWKQVCDSCGETIPVLIWKYNHQPMRVCVPLWSIDHTCEVKDNSVTVVLKFEHWLKYELAYNLGDHAIL
jgi:hypothetical protein|tara:strand:- start:2018 stop:2437 length:420 start_codon:yes stop_codon:yes gene_type:complete